MGETSCFLSSKGSSQLIYFHVPVILMLIMLLMLMALSFERDVYALIISCFRQWFDDLTLLILLMLVTLLYLRCCF